MALHVSIAAEPIAHIGSLVVTNSMFTTVLVTLFILLVSVTVSRSLKMVPESAGQQIMEMIVGFLADMCQTVGGKRWGQYFPIIAGLFMFILVANWSGLLPGVGTIVVYPEGVEHASSEQRVGEVFAAELDSGKTQGDDEAIDTVYEEGYAAEHDQNLVYEESHTEEGHDVAEGHVAAVPLLRAPTADLNTTLALAVVAVAYIQFVGIKSLGAGYFKKFFNFSSPIYFFVGILELISEISKIISFAFRLFGNIFAGEVLLAVIGFLIPVVASVPFIGLEIFVGFIQAFVFAILAVVFMSLAVQSHEAH